MGSHIITYTDGGSRGNPGPGAIGVVILDGKTNEKLFEWGKFIGHVTNNQAEYSALIAALEKAVEMKVNEVKCLLDSELVVKQLNKEYRVKDPNISELYQRVVILTKSFKNITFSHITREKNKEADKLVNEALDAKLKK